ncbi:MAG: hypothetical protein IPN86_00760 [Saprospiraceae bacterium]|nr:hypothetical protein [Saprospiraceae bacterium]
MKQYLILLVLLFTIQSIVQITILSKSSLIVVTEENNEEQSTEHKILEYTFVTLGSSFDKLQNNVIKNKSIPTLTSKAQMSPIMFVETPPPNKMFY